MPVGGALSRGGRGLRLADPPSVKDVLRWSPDGVALGDPVVDSLSRSGIDLRRTPASGRDPIQTHPGPERHNRSGPPLRHPVTARKDLVQWRRNHADVGLRLDASSNFAGKVAAWRLVPDKELVLVLEEDGLRGLGSVTWTRCAKRTRYSMTSPGISGTRLIKTTDVQYIPRSWRCALHQSTDRRPAVEIVLDGVRRAGGKSGVDERVDEVSAASHAGCSQRSLRRLISADQVVADQA